jgi:ATP-dependent DNA helicase RecQ
MKIPWHDNEGAVFHEKKLFSAPLFHIITISVFFHSIVMRSPFRTIERFLVVASAPESGFLGSANMFPFKFDLFPFSFFFLFLFFFFSFSLSLSPFPLLIRIVASSLSQQLQEVARFFSLDSLTSIQSQALTLLQKKKNVFVIAATGSGKSLCFQGLPHLLKITGNSSKIVVLVISPLTWLIQDQITKLSGLGYQVANLSAEGLSLDEVSKGTYTFVYATPEVLKGKKLEVIQQLYLKQFLCLIAVDEAHCVLNWGDSFRKDYQLLRRVVPLFTGVPVVALTATASPEVRDQIAKAVGLRNYSAVVQTQARENVFIDLRPHSDTAEVSFLRDLLSKLQTQGPLFPKTVIFCRTFTLVTSIFYFFHYHLVDKSSVEMYMSVTPVRLKAEISQDFAKLDSKIRLLVCTSAFGLGVDIKGISSVVHLSAPHSLDDYVQQIGRAGRGDEQASAIFFTHLAYSNKTMKDFVAADDCRRAYIHKVYGFSPPLSAPASCCHSRASVLAQ